MRQKNFALPLVLCALFLLPRAAGAEVGYVNILNGIAPDKAFVLERQGRILTPESVQTNLEEGDKVIPSPDVLLLFTPLDAACESVEIKDKFTASACPPAESGIIDAAYDFVTNEFLAAPQESVGTFATRGAGGKRVNSLSPRVLRLFIEDPALRESFKKTPFIALTDRESEAEVRVLGQRQVLLLSPGRMEGPRFHLPAEEAALRQALLNRINFTTIADLSSPGPWPSFEWIVNIHTPADNGHLEYDGRKWLLAKTIQVQDSRTEALSVPTPCLLTFALRNTGETPYYAYLVNYTPEGQLLPLLPNPEAPQFPNLIPVGEKLDLKHILLELGAAREFVRLIISQNPLDLNQFNQEGLNSPAASNAKPARLRPAPVGSWHTLAQTFDLR
jgi:hypothetical protein